MLDARLITPVKGLSISLFIPPRHMRMLVLVPMIHIRAAMILKVFPSPLNPIVKPLPFHLPIL
jgi:hypothetical protein